MHRLVTSFPKEKIVDHINRNKLDNRRANLRIADKSINAINSGLRNTNTSGYKGISWSKRGKKWEVYIGKDNIRIRLGLFRKIQEAIQVRKQAEFVYHQI
jgi:hypothetical protein